MSELKRRGVFSVMQLAGNLENLISELQLLAETGWNGGFRGWREGGDRSIPNLHFYTQKSLSNVFLHFFL